MQKAKHKWARRVLSFIMALAMIVTMAPSLPGGKMTAHAAAPEADSVNVAENGGAYDVTFEYTDANLTSCSVAGSFNNWGDTPMSNDGTGKWSVTVQGLAAGDYSYQIKPNDNWVSGAGNSSFTCGTVAQVNVKIYFKNTQNYDQPAIQVWGGNPTITGAGSPTEISGWGAQGYVLTKEGDYYTVTLQGTFDGCQFLDMTANGDGSHSCISISGDLLTTLKSYTATDTTNLYYINGSFYENPDDAVILTSPEVNGQKVTFRYNAPDATKVQLAGDMTEWQSGAIEMTKDAQGIWSLTKEIAPGKYGYKFIVNESDWKTDPVNGNVIGDNSLLVVPGLENGSMDAVKKGEETTLPTTLKLYDASGNTTNANVTYTLKTPNANVTLSGNKITVGAGYTEDTLELIVTAASGETSTMTLKLVDKIYTYTIYYYDWDETHMSTDVTDLWIWQKSGAGAKAGTPFTETEVLSDGNTWLKAEVTLAYTDVQIIPRDNSGSWAWQSETVSYNNKEEAENTTIYIVSNSKKAYTTIPELIPPRDRYVLVEYDRPQGDYEGWNIFTWNSGFGSEVSVPIEELGDKMVAKIPVKDSTADLMLSFCMRRSEEDNAWAEKDGGDHYVNVPADQSVVKAKFVQGEGITEVLPYNIGYEMDGANSKIHFYYRDDTLFADNELASLDGKVSITINGTAHEMKYDAAAERFVYDLSNVQVGDYYYYYTVDGEKKLDAFNEEKGTYSAEECSKCTYRKYDMTISAEMSQSSMDYNDNNVLTVKYNPAEGQSMDGFTPASATVDLSALGLSSTQAINTDLMELSIACKDTTTAGVKTLPVTVTDIYGNIYTTEASVTVTKRDKSDGDFDWDEAVIYFTVTDRFFDGDASNNDAYGVGDYNTGEDGGSSYHGGDFAGLNAKLDYLQDLGVNTIWITPIVENITEDQPDGDTGFSTYGYHGYWASDFTEINKHLGSKEEFKALLDAAHSRNMKIMVDVVLNHAGYGTEDYFNSVLKAEDGSAIAMIRDDDNTVSGDDKLDSLSGLPDFVTENEEVRNQLIEWQTDWMDEFDIDYYRVDTVKHVDSTTWAAFKNSLTKVNPDFKMIGEYAGAGYANTAGELGTGSMDSLLDFDFNGWTKDFVTGNISGIEQNLQKRNSAINNTATMGSFLSSHDEDSLQYTLINESGLSETEAYNLMKVAATLQITAKGQPIIYYGEEIGQAGANNWPYQTNRRDFDWAELEKQKSDSNSIYNHYKTMLGIRNDYSEVFAKGDRATVLQSDDDGYEVISRTYGKDTLYVGMNITETARNVVIPVDAEAGTVLTNLYDGKEYTVSAEKKVSITIPEAKNGGTIVLTEKKEEIRLVIPVSGADFTEVIDTINTVEDGTTITVITPDTTVIPAEVFNAMSGRDITVNFQLNDRVTWIVNGSSVKDKITTPIDLGVTIGSSSIPADKIKALAGDNKTLELSLAHDGAFGFDAKLVLNVGKEYSGKYANLYYYNESTGNLEYSQACKVDADGMVTFTFSHASEYVIVFSDSDMNPALSADTQNPAAASPKTGDSSPIGVYAVLLFVGGTAVVVVTRKRKRA